MVLGADDTRVSKIWCLTIMEFTFRQGDRHRTQQHGKYNGTVFDGGSALKHIDYSPQSLHQVTILKIVNDYLIDRNLSKLNKCIHLTEEMIQVESSKYLVMSINLMDSR